MNMADHDSTSPPLTAALGPAPQPGENNTSASAATGTGPAPLAVTASTRERVLDLVALLALITLSAVVFSVAGPAAFTAVTSVGMGLFATWRSNHPRPPRR